MVNKKRRASYKNTFISAVLPHLNADHSPSPTCHHTITARKRSANAIPKEITSNQNRTELSFFRTYNPENLHGTLKIELSKMRFLFLKRSFSASRGEFPGVQGKEKKGGMEHLLFSFVGLGQISFLVDGRYPNLHQTASNSYVVDTSSSHICWTIL